MNGDHGGGMHLEELTQLPHSRADRFYGKHRGLVLNNQDPQNIGRLQATVPEVLGEIRAKRAAIRAARGWVMDTYLLRPT